MSEKIFEDGKYEDRNFTFEEVRGVTWENCKFIETVFQFCVFMECVFESCDFSNAKPSTSRFIECTFKDSKLVGTNWSDTEEMRFLSFQSCLLNYSIFISLSLKSSSFTDCKMLEVNFSGSDLQESVFKDSDLLGVNFNNADLRKADLVGALNYLIDPQYTKIKGAQFSLPEVISLLSPLDIRII